MRKFLIEREIPGAGSMEREQLRGAHADGDRQPRPLDAGAVKARYQVGPIDPTILCVGDLDDKYGPDLLVKAMPGILKNHKQARLVVRQRGRRPV